MSINSFTLGESNTLTAGTTNEVSVGPNNAVNLTGQTSVTAMAASSLVLGTYLTAVNGTNATWTDGATLSLTSGATASYSDIARMQASEAVLISGGVHPGDTGADEAIESAETAVKEALKMLIAANLEYGSIVGGLTAENVDAKSILDLALKFGTIAAANTALAVIIKRTTEALATAYQAILSVSTLELSESGVNLMANFTPDSSANLMMTPETVALSRTGAAASAASAAAVEMDDTGAKLSFAGEGGISSLVVNGSTALLAAGTTELTVTEPALSASCGESEFMLSSAGVFLVSAKSPASTSILTLNPIDAGLSFQVGGITQGLGMDASGVYITGPATTQFAASATGISVQGPLIQLG